MLTVIGPLIIGTSAKSATKVAYLLISCRSGVGSRLLTVSGMNENNGANWTRKRVLRQSGVAARVKSRCGGNILHVGRPAPIVKRFACILSLLAVCGALSFARRSPPDAAPDLLSGCSALRAEANLVNVPVSVFDSGNRVVNHLTARAFHVFEDGVEQHVIALGQDDLPVSIGFIVDTSASMGIKVDAARQAVAEFMRSANPDDEFFLLPFDSHPGTVTGFTAQPGEILARLQMARPAGATALLDAIQTAFRTLPKARRERRVLVVISDGGDNRSRVTKSEILRMAREADAQVFTLGTYEPASVRHRTPEEFSGPELLTTIAEQSGGRSFPVRRLSDIADAAFRIGFEIRNQYAIAYRPSNQNWDGLYRHIAVKIDAPGFPDLHAYWRQGYYAAPPVCAVPPTS